MSKQVTDLPQWEEFEREARRHRRDPTRLLAELMRERLESWSDARLDEAIRADLQKSARKEADAVEMVRQYRQEKQRNRAST